MKTMLLTACIALYSLNSGKTQDLSMKSVQNSQIEQKQPSEHINTHSDPNTALKPLAEYETSLQTFHSSKLIADRTEYSKASVKKWWYYLPTVGYAFGGPTVSIGSNLVAQIDQDNQTRRNKLEAITAAADINYREELHQLRTQYRLIQLYHIDTTTAQIEAQIYQVSIDANRAKSITPVEHSKATLIYQTQQQQHTNEREAYTRSVIQLERLAKYDYPTDHLVTETEPAKRQRNVLSGFRHGRRKLVTETEQRNTAR